MAIKGKRAKAGSKERDLAREGLAKAVPAELSFDELGNRWVLRFFVESGGLTLKMLVTPGGVADAYEYEIWQGAERILTSSDNVWQHRMRAEFPDCIKVFDGMRQRWLLQRDATDSAWNAFFPKAESYGTARPDEQSDEYRRWAESMQREFGEVLETASRADSGLFMRSLEAIAGAVEAKDPDTLGHSQRVACYSVILAKELGLTEQEAKTVRTSAILHDVGKIGIEGRVLQKPGMLTNEESEIMRSHTLVGSEMVQGVAELQDTWSVVRSHHERYDGKGYPDGLAGDEIPIGARIIAVANAFDSMTSEHPYRRALPRSEARQRIAHEAGKQFDPEVVRVFLIIPDEVWDSALRTTD